MGYLIFAVIVGILGGTIGSIAGGGGLISFPLLVFLGLPNKMALATDKMGGVALSIGALSQYIKAGKVKWAEVLPLLAITLAGTIIGTNILISLDESVIGVIVIAALCTLLPVVLFKDRIPGNIALLDSDYVSVLGYVLYTLLIILGSIWGGGIGTLLIYTLVLFFSFNITEATATNLVCWFALSIVSSVILLSQGLVNLQIAIPLSLGYLIGGYLGAKIAISKGVLVARIALFIVVIASLIKFV